VVSRITSHLISFSKGFDRPNLYFAVTEKEGFSIVSYIRQRFRDATGIVYCMTKAECEIMADFLRDNGVSCLACLVFAIINIDRLLLRITMLVNLKEKGKPFKPHGCRVKLKLSARLSLMVSCSV
jgi:hypothetical protein